MNFKTHFTLPLAAMLFSIALVSCGGGEKTEEKEEDKKDGKEVPVKKAGDLKIGFVVIDSLNKHYKLIKLREEELAALEKEMFEDLEKERNRVIAAEEKYKKDYNILPLSDRAAQEKKLMQMAQNFQKKEQEINMQFQEKGLEMQNSMNKVLADYLEKYAKENGYDFILRYNSQLPLFYGDPQFDITQPILDGLNAEFDAANGGK